MPVGRAARNHPAEVAAERRVGLREQRRARVRVARRETRGEAGGVRVEEERSARDGVAQPGESAWVGRKTCAGEQRERIDAPREALSPGRAATRACGRAESVAKPARDARSAHFAHPRDAGAKSAIVRHRAPRPAGAGPSRFALGLALARFRQDLASWLAAPMPANIQNT